MNTIDPSQNLTATILAGGMARRMHCQDKGLVEFNNKPLIEHVIEALNPQVDSILINANRNLEQYQHYGYPVVKDSIGDYFGPLAGIASSLQICDSERIVVVPCDSPFIPPILVQRLDKAMTENQAEISVVNDGSRIQPVFAMIRKSLLPGLLTYLNEGGRRIDTWYSNHNTVQADFSDWPNAFININTHEEKLAAERENPT